MKKGIAVNKRESFSVGIYTCVKKYSNNRAAGAKMSEMLVTSPDREKEL